MAEPNEIANGDKSVAQDSKTETKIETKTELPVVESPPLSPAETLSEPVLDAQMKPQPASELKPEPAAAATVQPAKPRFAMPNIKMPALKIPAMKLPELKIATPKISRRMRRRAALAATIMLAAGFGAAVGAVAMRQPAQPPARPNTALLEENHALQRSVAKLNKDLTTLRANVETAARESKTQIAKATASLSDRLDKAMDVTGSIGKPATTAAAVSPPIADSAPLPQPRPSIVQGWTVREARNGRIWVENRGELYAVAPGVPLPGLGRVETIRREGDSLVVVTTRGLITETQTTASVRPRPQQRYYTPYWEPY
ncbi:MAG TPA: hypothetical protein VHD59_09855 [Pseudolabrys sp.]|jgi:hypothetical protein|nr:hypothetical protein [Pseudolabrys sp.]